MESIQMDQMYEGIVKTIRHPLLILDQDLMVILASSYFYEVFKVSPEETVGQLVYNIGNKQWDIPKLRELLEAVLPHKTSFDNYEVEHDFTTIGKRIMLLNARQIEQAMGKERIILLAIEDISERRQLKNLLADSEERYRRLFETADDGILLLEKSELKICFANPAITEMLGYSNEELIGKAFKDIGFADNVVNFQEVIQTLNKSGIIYYKDASIQKKTGQFVDTDIYMVKETRLVQCNIRNITERKKAENILLETEEKFSTAFQTSPYAITITRAKDGKFIEVNDAFMTMTGFTREEAHADSWIGLKLWMNKEDSDRVVNDLRAGRSVVSHEYQFRRKSDKFFIGSFSAGAILVGGEHCILSIIEDITERRAVEEALRQNEKKYRSLFNSIRDAILVANTNRMIIDCNPAFRELFGYSREDILGKQTLAIYENEKEYEEIGCAIKDYMGDPGFLFSVNYKKANGSAFPAETNFFYMKDDDGVIVGFIGLIRDVSKTKRAEEEQKKLQAQFTQAQKMESVGRLAGGVAHDFNNMLNVILGNTEMAMEYMAPDDPLQDIFGEIFSAAKRSADITQQLLAFARKQTITPKVLDFNDTIKSMLKILRRLIGEDIDLAWLPGANIWQVRIDPSQIDQILANLFVNARDAIADVGKITIETGNATFDSAYCVEHPGFVTGDFVQLTVSDDGCGMGQETLANLFEPFFTTKDVGKGTGLGLATVYGIVKQNNGFINVYSEPDQGTTFRIYLPRYLAETESPEKKTSSKINLNGTETILLVEDEPSILKMTRMMLERMGYKVLAADRPGEAISLARDHIGKIHILMTDVVMPEMNGRDLAKNILSLYPHLKCLFMSGYTANVIVHRGVLDEGVQFIQKPFSMEQLATRVREALDEDNL